MNCVDNFSVGGVTLNVAGCDVVIVTPVKRQPDFPGPLNGSRIGFEILPKLSARKMDQRRISLQRWW